MIKLKNLIKEFDYPKNKYVEPSSSELDDIKQTLFDLISNAYASIGGHLKIKSPDDIKDPNLNYWRVADIDTDPEIDVVYFGKKTPFGIKLAGMGQDGDKPNIKNLLIRVSSELKRPGNYIEVSGSAFDSIVSKGHVPVIEDESLIRKVLGPKGPDIIWHGKHPDGTKSGNGWYSRKIAGKAIIKTMVGNI